MTIKTGKVCVGATPTQIVTSVGATMTVLSKATGGAVYIGPDDTVTPATGFLWWSDDAPLELPCDGPLYGITVADGDNPTDVVISFLQVSP
jgi:hypothetical protein